MNFEGTRSSLNVELWSWYAIPKALSWMQFIWFNLRLWNIQTTGAQENWDAMKALRRRSFICSNFKEYAILAKAFSFWLVLLERDLTRGSNVSFLSKWIPRSFSHLLLEMAILPMLIWISCVEFVRRCDFSGFAFRKLAVNHLNKVFEFFSRSCNTLFKFVRWVGSVVVCVVCNIYIREKLE